MVSSPNRRADTTSDELRLSGYGQEVYPEFGTPNTTDAPRSSCIEFIYFIINIVHEVQQTCDTKTNYTQSEV